MSAVVCAVTGMGGMVFNRCCPGCGQGVAGMGGMIIMCCGFGGRQAAALAAFVLGVIHLAVALHAYFSGVPGGGGVMHFIVLVMVHFSTS